MNLNPTEADVVNPVDTVTVRPSAELISVMANTSVPICRESPTARKGVQGYYGQRGKRDEGRRTRDEGRGNKLESNRFIAGSKHYTRTLVMKGI